MAHRSTYSNLLWCTKNILLDVAFLNTALHEEKCYWDYIALTISIMINLHCPEVLLYHFSSSRSVKSIQLANNIIGSRVFMDVT